MLNQIYFIIPFLALCISCGSDIFPKDTILNPSLELGEFKPYVESFVYDGSMHGVHLEIKDLIIRFGDLNRDARDDGLVTLGICRTAPFKTPKIYIDSNHWEDMNEYKRTALIYHELGHCILKRGHIDKRVSLMNSFIISSETFSKHYNGLVKELFTRKPVPVSVEPMLNLMNNHSNCQYHNHETEEQ